MERGGHSDTVSHRPKKEGDLRVKGPCRADGSGVGHWNQRPIGPLFFDHQAGTSFDQENCPGHHSFAHVVKARKEGPAGSPHSIIDMDRGHGYGYGYCHGHTNA